MPTTTQKPKRRVGLSALGAVCGSTIPLDVETALALGAVVSKRSAAVGTKADKGTKQYRHLTRELARTPIPGLAEYAEPAPATDRSAGTTLSGGKPSAASRTTPAAIRTTSPRREPRGTETKVIGTPGMQQTLGPRRSSIARIPQLTNTHGKKVNRSSVLSKELDAIFSTDQLGARALAPIEHGAEPTARTTASDTRTGTDSEFSDLQRTAAYRTTEGSTDRTATLDATSRSDMWTERLATFRKEVAGGPSVSTERPSGRSELSTERVMPTKFGPYSALEVVKAKDIFVECCPEDEDEASVVQLCGHRLWNVVFQPRRAREIVDALAATERPSLRIDEFFAKVFPMVTPPDIDNMIFWTKPKVATAAMEADVHWKDVLSPDMVDGLEAIFDAMDADGSGTVSLLEIKNTLNKNRTNSTAGDSYHWTIYDIEELVSEFDENDNAELDKDEFMKMMAQAIHSTKNVILTT